MKTFGRISNLAAIFLFLTLVPGQKALNADAPDDGLFRKEVFNGRYPEFFVFRGEYDKEANSSYGNFVRSGADGAGFIQKYVPYDELPRIDPVLTAGFASRYVTENPEKLVLLHWDAEEHVNIMEESASKYFPGHWATLRASSLTRDCSPYDREIFVADIEYFSKLTKNKKARSKWEYPMLLLVALDKNGKPDWEHYEYVAVDNVNESESSITVRRGQALSTPMAFAEGSRVAQILTYLSSEHLFMFNYSTSCPRDRNGHNAIDVQLDELVSLFDKDKGLLRNLDGISFDVLNWNPPIVNSFLIDSDSDGLADGATDPYTGENLWRKGAVDFQKRLRAHFGEDFILINDGYNFKDQRAMGLFNGIESEGLVKHNDAFRGFSKTMNVFSYWNSRNPMKYKLMTFVPKVNNPVDMLRKEQYTRLCTAVATCLDAALNISPVKSEESLSDELRCGDEGKLHWLGSPVSGIIYADAHASDILSNRFGTADAVIAGFSTENSTMEAKDSVLMVKGKNPERYDLNCLLRTPVFRVPDGVNDIVVSFSVMADEGLAGLSSDFPRIVRVTAEGLPQYEDNKQNNDMYNDMWGLFDCKGYVEQTFLYRNVAGKDLSFEIEVEGQGAFRLKDFRILASSGAFYREYENGLVLVNPSLNEYTFDLDRICPDSVFRRIKGRSQLNDGSQVRGKITVAPADAMFLVSVVPRAQGLDMYEYCTVTDGTGTEMPCRLLSPADIDRNVKYPLFVYLHGMGLRGTDNEKQLSIGASVFLDSLNRIKYPCYVLYPQTPETFVEVKTPTRQVKGGFNMWSKNLDNPSMAGTTTVMSKYGNMVIGLIKDMIAAGKVDPERVYVAGSSMGAYSTYHFIAQYPELFAAASPMGGGADMSLVDLWAGKVPVWIFHGLSDTIVLPENDERIIAELKAENVEFRYTLYEGVPHNCWSKAFEEPDFLEWIFSHRKRHD